jgi:F-type H+-transporting ATPase subunit epsilon
MRLKLLLPTHIEIDEEVNKVTAEALAGAFTLLPRHVDYVAPLGAGILSYENAQGEQFVAINGGILVKTGDEVRVAATEAAAGRELSTLEDAVRERFQRLDEGESRAQRAVQRIEADFVRRFIELEENAQA